jgi:hypothetical protein
MPGIGKPFDEVLQDRLTPLFTSMLLYMNNYKETEWTYKTIHVVDYVGDIRKKQQPIEERYEVVVTVRKL